MRQDLLMIMAFHLAQLNQPASPIVLPWPSKSTT